MDSIQPSIVIIGEAPSDKINYLSEYNTITQNSAGDIVFDCQTNIVHIYVSSKNYSVDFLDNENKTNKNNATYIGSLKIE